MPDSAAAASALATGIRVKTERLRQQNPGAPLQTILEIAHQEGRATGIVTDGALTNPTVAAFYAPREHREAPQQFATTMIEQSAVDIALGGGAADFDKAKLDQTRVRVVQQFAGAGNKSADGNSRACWVFLQLTICRLPTKLQREPTNLLLPIWCDARSSFSSEPSWLCPRRECSFDGFSGMAENLGERTLRETAELDRAVQIEPR